MLDAKVFATMVSLSAGELLSKIAEYKRVNDTEAANLLYSSQLYADLENQRTGVWTFSVPLLFDLWKEEHENGHINYPE